MMFSIVLPLDICEDGELRLVGATATPVSGRVEICFDETWGTIVTLSGPTMMEMWHADS